MFSGCYPRPDSQKTLPLSFLFPIVLRPPPSWPPSSSPLSPTLLFFAWMMRDHTNVGMWKATSFLSPVFRILLSDSSPSVDHAGFVWFWPILLYYSELCPYGPQKVFSYCALCFRWKLKRMYLHFPMDLSITHCPLISVHWYNDSGCTATALGVKWFPNACSLQ